MGAQGMPNVNQFGPQIGDVVPAFSLSDQTGQNRTLPSIMGPNGTMLVFSRSASDHIAKRSSWSCNVGMRMSPPRGSGSR